MLYYFDGPENYLKIQEIEKAKKKLEDPEMNFREFHEWDPEIRNFLTCSSFISEKKICVLHFFPEEESFLGVCGTDNADIYLVPEESPDSRKTIVRQILNESNVRKFEKIDDHTLLKCIYARLSKHGFQKAQMDEVQEELKRAFQPYLMDYKVGLDTVIVHVDMIGYSGSLTPESIQTFSLESSSLKGYKLATMVLNREKGCIDFTDRLLDQGESAISLLSLVLFQIRVCYKASLFSEKNYLKLIGIRNYQLYPNFERYSPETYGEMYGILQDAVNRIKRGEKAKPAVIESINRCLDLTEKIKRN